MAAHEIYHPSVDDACVYNRIILIISSSFKMFDQNLALTQGGPYKSTEMIALNITILPLEQMNLVLHRQRQSFF